MIRSLTAESTDAVLTADVAVVGGGPVGIVAALTLLAYGLAVVLVESGGRRPDPHLTYLLGAARVTGDERFGVLEGRVLRGVGGTSWRWMVDLEGLGQGVRYAVMEPGVLARRTPGRPCWPHGADDLRPWYRAALDVAGVDPEPDQLDPRPSDRVPGLDHSVYMFGPASAFQAQHLADRLAEPRLTVLTDATATALVHDGDPSRITGVEVRHRSGSRAVVRADQVMLTAGTVDTTRLLLAAQRTNDALRGNDRIGRNLMDRPRLYGTWTMTQDPPDWLADYAMHRHDRHLRMHRWITDAGAAERGTASTSFLPLPAHDVSPRRARLEHLARRSLIAAPAELLPRLTCRLPDSFAAPLHAGSLRTYGLRAAAMRRATRGSYDTEWAGWARDDAWRRERVWRLTAITEQVADDANRITLTDEVDELGVPRAHLEWGCPSSVTPAIHDSITRATDAFATAGLGEVSWGDEQLAAVSSCHMMGTVAIGDDPATSAADPDGRVRGTDNLYVAGNAVIPQSGHANPTLVAMALAARTATVIATGGPGATPDAAGTLRA